MPSRIDLTNYELDLERTVEEAAEKLRDGKLLVLPTETVYGIAARIDKAEAIDAVNNLRIGSTRKGPLTPHLADPDEAKAYVGEVGEVGRRLMKKLWPGPVAIVFGTNQSTRDKTADALRINVDDLYDDEGNAILRCPDDLFTQAVLARVGQPTIVTRLGLPSGADATRVPEDDEVPDGVDTIYDGGPTRFAKASTVVKITDDGWKVVREGIYDTRIVERLLRTTLLFVCSGNTCRSPMAMALARKYVADKLGVGQDELPSAGWEILSAGTHAMGEMRATPAAAEAMAGMGADLASHRSQPLTVGLIHRADLILTMGRSHSQAALSLVPSAKEKIMTLSPDGDIDDPIGASAAHYRTLAGELDTWIQKRIDESGLLEQHENAEAGVEG